MSNNKTFFHCSPLPLQDSSIILPGNWGRIIRQYTSGDGNSFPIAYRETVLEATRLTLCPQKPSRLDCVFVCPTQEGAVSYKARWGRTSIIYEVEETEPTDIPHFGDFQLVLFLDGVPYFDNFPTRAAQYWKGDETACPEVLLRNPIRILRRVDAP